MSKRIIFFGTPEFAGICLSKILEENFSVVAVITAADKPSGRGKKINPSAVKKIALEKNLKVLQPSNLKDPAFVNELKELKPDLMVVVAFRMLPKVVWSIPIQGTFNLHASLLPNYRGAAPINWAIINQEKTTGVTTFFIDDKIDSGEILLQNSVAISPKDNAGSLHDKLAEMGSELVCTTIQGIFENSIKSKVQQLEGSEKSAPKLDKQNTFIDWSQSLDAIGAKIEGLSPYPGAKTKVTEGGSTTVIKIFEAQLIKEPHTFQPNKIVIENRKILITHKEGFLNCINLQFPGKKKMAALDILNGRTFSSEMVVN